MKNLNPKSQAWFLLIALSSCCFSNCNDNSDPDRITGKYKILRMQHDSARTISLVKEFGKNSAGSGEEIPPNVVAVGHNEDFIVVQQHPTTGYEGGYKPDTTITKYYIIDMKNKFRKYLEMNIGPLTKIQFDSLRALFKIENIQFDKLYPAIP
ncbi:MAG: DUF3997 domain-containing protein [Sphingobacteriales bacterium]|nr:DUF3997 domain-containing protein [Sphingobacteriales bacterium]